MKKKNGIKSPFSDSKMERGGVSNEAVPTFSFRGFICPQPDAI